MHPIIKQQLMKVKAVDLPAWDDSTTNIIINKKEDATPISMQVNHYYVIQLKEYLLNPPQGFDLHVNWNNNVIPKSLFYKCQCLQLMGKMVKIFGVGFDYDNRRDLDDEWVGWLPLKSITVIREI